MGSALSRYAREEAKRRKVMYRQMACIHEPIDLSGAAKTIYLMHFPRAAKLIRCTFVYTEASSADAGVKVEIGKEADRNYYYDTASEVSKAQWYETDITLLKDDIAAGDTLTVYNTGGKTGTGEIMVCIEYGFLE